MLDDPILLWRSKRGDRKAFDLLYERHVDTLLTVAMNLLSNASDAEDAVQEVFASIVESLDKITLRSSLRNFLAVCVANKSRDMLRRRNRPLADPNGPTPPSEAPETLELVTHNEQVHRLVDALARLPYEQREVITLHVHAGLTFRAMARALNVSLGTVQSRYRYGLSNVKAALNGESQT
ncbi:MAG: RNA polymerase sigma factor [Sedimentisphaerales bacterium]|nr:RNA polymerase sigma factor [Sedimentisphaerales bacterium]